MEKKRPSISDGRFFMKRKSMRLAAIGGA